MSNVALETVTSTVPPERRLPRDILSALPESFSDNVSVRQTLLSEQA